MVGFSRLKKMNVIANRKKETIAIEWESYISQLHWYIVWAACNEDNRMK